MMNVGALTIFVLALAGPLSAQQDPAKDLEELKQKYERELEELKQKFEREIEALKQRTAPLPKDEVRATVKDVLNEQKKVDAGFGDVKLSGLFQIWLQFIDNDLDNTPVDAGAAGGLFDDDDSWRLRRTEISLSGNIVKDRVSWGLMLDLARAIQGGPETAAVQTRRILQDVYIRFQLPKLFDSSMDEKWFNVDIGQFKPGITWEGTQSSAKLDFVDRALLVRTFGDVRDIGVKVHSDFDFIAFNVGVYNGEGQNTVSDLNDHSMFAGRLIFRPFNKGFEGFEDSVLKGLEFGVSAQGGGVSTTEAVSASQSNSRFGVHLVWEMPKLFDDEDKFWVRGEWMRGRRAVTPALEDDLQGWYASAGYRFLSDYEVGLRYEHFDPGTVTAAAGAQPFSNLNQWSIGFTWYIENYNAKVQANYFINTEPGSGVEFDNDMFVIGFQIAY